MRTNRPSCKYYKVCGSVDNCPGCIGYQKKRVPVIDQVEEIEEAVRQRNLRKKR